MAARFRCHGIICSRDLWGLVAGCRQSIQDVYFFPQCCWKLILLMRNLGRLVLRWTCRNAGTLLSRVVVFCVGWGFFGADASTKVTPDDAQNFMVRQNRLSLIRAALYMKL